MAIEVDNLLKIGWVIAEREAIALGAESIEPIHFLLAALKIADPEFPAQLDKLDITSEEWKMISEEAMRLRCWLEVLPDHVTDARRRLRYRLARNVGSRATVNTLHRSRKTKAAFYDASAMSNDGVLTLRQVIESMFYLGFVDVSDMRWLGETQTVQK